MLLFTMDSGVECQMVSVGHLGEMLKKGLHKVLIIDSRSFLEHNTCHISESVNVCCSKLVKRRLQQDKVSVKDLLAQTCHVETDAEYDIIVYDQCTTNPCMLSADCFLIVLLKKLVKVFKSVSLLDGGFLEFQATHPSLCESKTTGCSPGGYKCTPLTSMSQPCLPVSNLGPTKILPFLYLGSQYDALSQEIMKVNDIMYILNVSTTCAKPSFIQDGHFLRIPVSDNYCDKLLPFFQDAFQFLDKVREANGSVIVHCLAGISRSPTLAIAYLMYHLHMTSDEAYKYVKDKRPTISPNFNFLGQLLEYEKQLKQKREGGQCSTEAASLKKQCIEELRSPTSPTVATPKLSFSFRPPEELKNVPSPTTQLARLHFDQPSPVTEQPAATVEARLKSEEGVLPYPTVPTTFLDSLSFTPCQSAVKDEPPKTLNITINKPLGGHKRPMSTRLEEGFRAVCTGSSGPTTDQQPAQVTLRSPETKAKRPLVRPNSIAFSSYPKFDFSSEGSISRGQVETRMRSPSLDQVLGSGQPRDPPGSPLTHRDMDTGSPSLSRQTRPSQKAPTSLLPGLAFEESLRFEQARKSRSLEDILSSPDEENTGCGCSDFRRPHQLMQVADIFAPPLGLESIQSCRGHGPGDSHQSSSSISSSGSHNSLHGSLEIIQVS